MTRSEDLVARLRDVGFCGWDTQQEAADEIERLNNIITELKAHTQWLTQIAQERIHG